MDNPVGPMPDFLASLAGTLQRVELPGITVWELLVAFLCAVAVCTVPPVWRVFSLFVALVHELGHAFAAFSVGHRRITVKVQRDGNGVFESYGFHGLNWATFWGYPVPAFIGAGLVGAALSGWGPLAGSFGALALVLALPAMRNRFGFLLALGCAGVALALVWLASPVVASHVGLFFGVGLLVASVRDFLRVWSAAPASTEEATPSDAHLLAERTGVPAGAWMTLFVGGIGAAWCAAGAAAAPLILAR